jgi:hypothetical protein
MEKATKLKARKNLDDTTNKGNSSQNLSFNKLVDSDIIARTSSLGVVLGKTEDAVLSTVNSLREIEITRMNESVSLKEGKINNLAEVTTESSIDEGINLEALNFLCSDITDCLCDGGCDPTDLQTPVSHMVKPRSTSRKKIKREQNLYRWKGFFWNCNGFAYVKKYRFLVELTKEKSLDFIALSETGRANIP